MSDEGCGDATCTNCGGDGSKGTTWRTGLDEVFDSTYAGAEKLEKKGEHPIGMVAIVVGSGGTLAMEVAGAGSDSVIDLIMAEVCLQVADILHARGLKDAPPEVAAIMEKINKEHKPD